MMFRRWKSKPCRPLQELEKADDRWNTNNNEKSKRDVQPDKFVRRKTEVADAYDYGYAVPDAEHQQVDYGYGDGAPTTSRRNNSESDIDDLPQPRRKTPRRSSMKQQGAVRRSSIGYSGEMNVQLPGRKETVKRRTSISFREDKNEVKEVEPLKNEELWFKKEEYHRIRQKARMLTDAAKNGHPDAVKKLCIRGLEYHFDSDLVCKEQDAAWSSVFQEQRNQHNMGTFDDEVVSKIYRIQSNDSARRAVERARQDSIAAQKCATSSFTRNARSSRLRRSSIS